MTITLERVPAGGPAREELTALLPGYLRGWAWTPTTRICRCIGPKPAAFPI